MLIAGIDLAWKSQANPTALAVGKLYGRTLTLSALLANLYGVDAIMGGLAEFPDIQGIAIDGPLVIGNLRGQRECETRVGSVYGSRGASCHTSNLTLFPSADSVRLANVLRLHGFAHLGLGAGKWQIECYPHPALIEIFGLAQRHAYKKGRVEARRRGQCELAMLLQRLGESAILQLIVPSELKACMTPQHIAGLAGLALKRNEDILDAIVCAYVGALYTLGVNDAVFGDATNGYIYVPQTVCI